jgi:hypothetical protein
MTTDQRALLSALAGRPRWGCTTPAERRVMASLKREGWVRKVEVAWRLTDSGKKALSAEERVK